MEISEKQHVCHQCGALLKVTYPRTPGFNDKEEYNCPKCDTEYYVKTSGIPYVEVIDGQ